jgi:hypothetical protein
MNYTTYYRKDVWERFKDEPDKSDLINRLLTEHYDDVAVEKVIEAQVMSPQVVPSTSRIATNKVSEVCKHGSSPQFCKYAKPGKPCK